MRYLLVLLFVISLAACDTTNAPQPTPDPIPIPEPNPEPQPNPEPEPKPNPATPGGALDESFGAGGTVAFADKNLVDIAIQADGKIVTFEIVERELDNGGSERLYSVKRFNTDGTPDQDFAESGEFIVENLRELAGVSSSDAEAVTINSAGRICFVGTSSQFVAGQGFQDFPVVGCLTPEGEPDTSFDDDGFAFPKSSLSQSISLSDIQSDPSTGDLVIGGTIFPTDDKRAFWLFRMAANGEGKGETIVRFPNEEADFRSFAFLPNGDILAVGSVGVPFTGEGGFDTAVARVNKDGPQQLNVFDFNLFKSDFGSEVMIDERGRAVLAVALFNSGSDSRGVLARLEPATLTLDPSFGDKGVVRTSVFAEYFVSVAVDSENRILAAGATFNVTDDDDDSLAARYLEDGQPDPTFGTLAIAGRVTFNFDKEGDEVVQIALDPNGNIVLAGELDDTSVLARLKP
jgi:uncharacterized delta-60 repeat protein